MSNLFTEDESNHLNGQILDSVGEHEVPENAEIVFENHFQDDAPKVNNKKKRIIIMICVLTVILGIGYVLVKKKQSSATPPVASDTIDQAVAAVPNTAFGNIAIAQPESSVIPAGVEQAITPPIIEPATKPTVHDVVASSLKAEPVVINKPASVVEKDDVKSVRLSKRKTPETEPLIIARNKTVQTVLMRNMGVVAIMTDGLIMRKGEQDVEVSIGDMVPGWGVIQRTSPRDRTVETDEKIFKFN